MKKYKIILVLVLIVALISGCSNSPQNNKENVQIEKNKESQEDKKEVAVINTEKPEEEPINNEKSETENKPEDIIQDMPIEETTRGEESILSEETTNENNQTIIENESESSETEEKEVAIKIEGLADNELTLTLDELKAMVDIIFEEDFYWLNSFGSKGHTHFKGVNLWSLLEQKALISATATKVSIIAQDGYQMDFSIEQVKEQDYIDETNPEKNYPMIIAWEENGEEYDPEEGAPFKLVVGQKEAGDVNKPQWVSNIDRIVIE